eukprot:15355945-Alexandrium_andersonii.AAC.1
MPLPVCSPRCDGVHVACYWLRRWAATARASAGTRAGVALVRRIAASSLECAAHGTTLTVGCT